MIKSHFFGDVQMPNQFVVATSDASNNFMASSVSELLRDARTLLDMDIAFVSEFSEGQRFIRRVDQAADSTGMIHEGMSNPLEETYCQRVVDGRLPLAIPDTQLLPEAKNLDITETLNIRAYLAAPIALSNGQIFGTLCCISHRPRTALGNRQTDALRIIAERVAIELQKNLARVE